MTTGKEESSQSENGNTPPLQPIIYGYMPEPRDDEIDLAELLSRLAKQWKLILGITFGGTILALVLALSLPKVYEPTISISVPSISDVAQLQTINALFIGDNDNISSPYFMNEGEYSSIDEPVYYFFNLQLSRMKGEIIPSSPQTVFKKYYDVFRSEKVWSEYLQNIKNLPRYSDKLNQNKGNLAGVFNAVISTKIEEPTPHKKGGYVRNPKRVSVALKVQNEEIGVELLNGYPDFVNQKLIEKLHKDAKAIIKSRVDELGIRIARMREQYKLERQLKIQRKEQENDEQIALLLGEVTVLSAREKGSRDYEVKITSEINVLREKIHLIETDPVLAALKKRKTDDPWIEGLPEMVAELETLKSLNPDLEHVMAYSLDESAVVTGEAIKPKRAVIVFTGLVISFVLSVIIVVLFVRANKESGKQ
jgi:chain length determinant protein (polysaccharide antigen chain regulator)